MVGMMAREDIAGQIDVFGSFWGNTEDDTHIFLSSEYRKRARK
jgi:hypothetical protein